MKESEYIEGLAKYLVKRDEHLGLSIEQANQLVEYIRQYEDKCGMLPPFNPEIEESKVGYGAAYLDDESVRKTYCNHFCKWESED